MSMLACIGCLIFTVVLTVPRSTVNLLKGFSMKHRLFLLLTSLFIISLIAGLLLWIPSRGAHASATYDINTLAGKVASVNGTAGLQIRMSAFIQQEADAG